MKKEMDTVLEAFRLHDPRKEPVAAGLAQALSERAELSVEVTFDMAAQDPATLLYVDLVNATDDTSAHLSIRVKAQCVVLNVMERGTWKKSIAAGINFEALRYWRLWLVVEADGAFSVRLGDVTLCRYVGGLVPAEIAKIASNVSARCVLGMPAAGGSVPAIPAGSPPATRPVPPCGLWDRAAPRGSVALIHAPHLGDAGPAGLQLLAGTAAVEILETTPLMIAGKKWLACRLEEHSGGHYSGAACLRGVGPEGEFQIFEVRAHPVVELSAGDITLRTQGRMPPDEVVWRCPLTGRQTAVRLVTRSPGDVTQAGGVTQADSFTRFITPLSEILRLVPQSGPQPVPQSGPQSGGVTLLALDIAGLPATFYQLALSAKIYTRLETFVSATLAAALTAALPVSADLRMIFLDWWSVLHLPEPMARIAALAPDLHQFLEEQRQFAGEVMQGDPAAPEAAPEAALEDGPGAEAIPVWRAMRSVSGLFADPATSPQSAPHLASHLARGDVLRRQVLALCGLLRVPERHYFLLDLSGPLLGFGLGDILNAEIPDAFVAEMLVPDSTPWHLSAVLGPLAARHRFADCASLVFPDRPWPGTRRCGDRTGGVFNAQKTGCRAAVAGSLCRSGCQFRCCVRCQSRCQTGHHGKRLERPANLRGCWPGWQRRRHARIRSTRLWPGARKRYGRQGHGRAGDRPGRRRRRDGSAGHRQKSDGQQRAVRTPERGRGP